VRLDADGVPLLARTFPAPDGGNITAVAVAAPTDAVAVGYTTNGDTDGLLVTRVVADGTPVWTFAPPGGPSGATAVAVDPSGRIAVAGVFRDSLTLGGDTLESSDWDAVVFVLDGGE
jgi:hypothetical protein